MESSSAGLKPWEPETLSPVHKNILMLLAAGMRAREISQMEGMPSESRISVIKNSPAGTAFLKQASEEIGRRISKDARDIVNAHTTEAVLRVLQIMRGSDSDAVALRAAQDILDRGGLKPVDQSQVMHIAVEEKDVSRIVQALNESKEDHSDLEEIDDSSALFSDPDEIMVLE